MKKLCNILIILGLFCQMTCFAASTAANVTEKVGIKAEKNTVKNSIIETMRTRSDEVKTTEVIVSFANLSKAPWILRKDLKGIKYFVKDKLSIIDAYVIKFNSIAEMERAIILLNNSEDIVFAEPNYLIIPNLGSSWSQKKKYN